MSWRVRKGITVHCDGSVYEAGAIVPCTDAQAAAMVHAVEAVEEPFAAMVERLKAENPRSDGTEVPVVKATKKRGQ